MTARASSSSGDLPMADEIDLADSDAMAHRAGLPALDIDRTLDEMRAPDPVIRAIEAQRSTDPPYAGHLDHAMTCRRLAQRAEPGD